MKSALLTISTARHLHWLRTAARSIATYASGFAYWQLMLPRPHTDEWQSFIDDYNARQPRVPLRIGWFDEWPGKGKLHHMALIMEADLICPDSECLVAWDSDMVLLAPLHPEDLMREGKPAYGYIPFAESIAALPPVANWQIAAERALGWPVDLDFMVFFPVLLLPSTLAKTRDCVTTNAGMLWKDYIRAQRNEFPEGFAEYNTLGAVAWKFFHDEYHWIRHPGPQAEIVANPLTSAMYKGWAWRCFTSEESSRFTKAGLLP